MTALENVAYQSNKSHADPAWAARAMPGGAWEHLPACTAVRFEAKTSFDRFTDMEVVADDAEQAAVTSHVASHDARATFLAFPEDRDHPIRMTERIPARWLASVDPLAPAFPRLAARPGEYYVAQVSQLQ